MMSTGKEGARLDDVTCPICLEILIEPVVLPCAHELCMPCFREHIDKTSLQCPICRCRISNWAREAGREKKLVDRDRWEFIQRNFATQIRNRKLGIESKNLSCSASSFHDAQMNLILAEPGEIHKEYLEECKKAEEERQREREREEEASRALIERLRKDDDMAMRQIEESDAVVAEHLQNLNGSYLVPDALNEIRQEVNSRTRAYSNYENLASGRGIPENETTRINNLTDSQFVIHTNPDEIFGYEPSQKPGPDTIVYAPKDVSKFERIVAEEREKESQHRLLSDSPLSYEGEGDTRVARTAPHNDDFDEDEILGISRVSESQQDNSELSATGVDSRIEPPLSADSEYLDEDIPSSQPVELSMLYRRRSNSLEYYGSAQMAIDPLRSTSAELLDPGKIGSQEIENRPTHKLSSSTKAVFESLPAEERMDIDDSSKLSGDYSDFDDSGFSVPVPEPPGPLGTIDLSSSSASLTDTRHASFRPIRIAAVTPPKKQADGRPIPTELVRIEPMRLPDGESRDQEETEKGEKGAESDDDDEDDGKVMSSQDSLENEVEEKEEDTEVPGKVYRMKKVLRSSQKKEEDKKKNEDGNESGEIDEIPETQPPEQEDDWKLELSIDGETMEYCVGEVLEEQEESDGKEEREKEEEEEEWERVEIEAEQKKIGEIRERWRKEEEEKEGKKREGRKRRRVEEKLEKDKGKETGRKRRVSDEKNRRRKVEEKKEKDAAEELEESGVEGKQEKLKKGRHPVKTAEAQTEAAEKKEKSRPIRKKEAVPSTKEEKSIQSSEGAIRKLPNRSSRSASTRKQLDERKTDEAETIPDSDVSVVPSSQIEEKLEKSVSPKKKSAGGSRKAGGGGRKREKKLEIFSSGDDGDVVYGRDSSEVPEAPETKPTPKRKKKSVERSVAVKTRSSIEVEVSPAQPPSVRSRLRNKVLASEVKTAPVERRPSPAATENIVVAIRRIRGRRSIHSKTQSSASEQKDLKSALKGEKKPSHFVKQKLRFGAESTEDMEETTHRKSGKVAEKRKKESEKSPKTPKGTRNVKAKTLPRSVPAKTKRSRTPASPTTHTPSTVKNKKTASAKKTQAVVDLAEIPSTSGANGAVASKLKTAKQTGSIPRGGRKRYSLGNFSDLSEDEKLAIELQKKFDLEARGVIVERMKGEANEYELRKTRVI